MALVKPRTCLWCRGTFKTSEMADAHGKEPVFCKTCARAVRELKRQVKAAQRQAKAAQPPAPRRTPHASHTEACGVPQAEHWRCSRCTSRGHLMGRGKVFRHLCGWCEEETARGR